jgi:hypothetical protein
MGKRKSRSPKLGGAAEEGAEAQQGLHVPVFLEHTQDVYFIKQKRVQMITSW